MTHYIPAFTERTGRLQRAACGWLTNMHEHSLTPSCALCRAFLEAEATDGMDAEVEALKQAPSEFAPVKYVEFDPTGGRAKHRG